MRLFYLHIWCAIFERTRSTRVYCKIFLSIFNECWRRVARHWPPEACAFGAGCMHFIAFLKEVIPRWSCRTRAQFKSMMMMVFFYSFNSGFLVGSRAEQVQFSFMYICALDRRSTSKAPAQTIQNFDWIRKYLVCVWKKIVVIITLFVAI